MKPTLYYFSLALNALFILGLIVIAIVYQDKIYKKMFPRTSENTSFVLLGNSITQFGNWKKLLDRNDFVNSGMAGYTTGQYLFPLPEVVLKYKPKVCFVEGGINDFGLGLDVQRVYTNLIDIIIVLQKNNVVPVIQSTTYSLDNPEVNVKVTALNILLKEYAQQHQLDFIDLNALTAKDGKLNSVYAIDSVHLNEKAYELWAIEVKKVLEKYLKQ